MDQILTFLSADESGRSLFYMTQISAQLSHLHNLGAEQKASNTLPHPHSTHAFPQRTTPIPWIIRKWMGLRKGYMALAPLISRLLLSVQLPKLIQYSQSCSDCSQEGLKMSTTAGQSRGVNYKLVVNVWWWNRKGRCPGQCGKRIQSNFHGKTS